MKKLIGAACAVLAATMMTGCSPAGGTAAVVNGQAISDSQITTWSKGCDEALKSMGQQSDAATIRPIMVRWAVLAQSSNDYLADHPIAGIDDQVDAYVRQSKLGPLLDQPACGQLIHEFGKHNLLVASLGANAEDYLGGIEVELNPRYGEWDAANLDLVAQNSLSVEIQQ